MPSHFQNYVTNFNRIRMSELIDHYALQARTTSLQASLIFNPVTNRCYSEGFTASAPSTPTSAFAL